MANQFTNRTIHLDTNMTSGYQEQAAVIALGTEPRSIRVKGIKLIGGSTASNATIIEPLSGDKLISMQCAAGGVDYTPFPNVTVWRDFEMSFIGGTGAFVEIYTV